MSASAAIANPRVPVAELFVRAETRKTVAASEIVYAGLKVKLNPFRYPPAVATIAWDESRRVAVSKSEIGNVPVAVTLREVSFAGPRDVRSRSARNSPEPLTFVGATLCCSTMRVAREGGLKANPLVSSQPSNERLSNATRREALPFGTTGMENSRRFASAPRPAAAGVGPVGLQWVQSSPLPWNVYR